MTFEARRVAEVATPGRRVCFFHVSRSDELMLLPDVS
jgi:hypothetical protein